MTGYIGKQYLNIRSAAKSLLLHKAAFNHIRLAMSLLVLGFMGFARGGFVWILFIFRCLPVM